MSSASRQVGTRRLPPLPLQQMNKRGTSSPQNHGRSAVKHQQFGVVTAKQGYGDQMVVTGQSPPVSNGTPRGHQKTNFHPSDTLSHEIGQYSPENMQADQVKNFLGENPGFLEDYLVNDADREVLLKCVDKRAQKQIEDGTEKLSVGSNIGGRRLSRWTFAVHKDKRKLLEDLTREIYHNNAANKGQILCELTDCIATAINADGCNVYTLEEDGTELHHCKPEFSSEYSPVLLKRNSSVPPNKKWGVKVGGTIASYVAHTYQVVRTTNLKNGLYPQGIAVEHSNGQAVLALPVIKSNGQVTAVIELFRISANNYFTEAEEEIAGSYLVWGGMSLHYAELFSKMTKQKKLNDFLLNVTKSIFTDIISMDTVIMKIMNFAQKLVHADRASLFLCDNKSRELYARIFDIGNGEGNQPAKTHTEIRFPMSRGVAGHVATTGEVLNITDAYQDKRFNREVDQKTGYFTKSILCMPIYIRGSIIGVMQMVNKKNGVFATADEEAFETFAIYCGLALHHAKLYDKIRRSEQKLKVAVEVLSYHHQCSEQEYERLRNTPLPSNQVDLARYEFSPWDLDEEAKPLYVLCMFKDLFDITSEPIPQRTKGTSENIVFDYDDLCRFTLTVRKNYRKVPYHNWTHAFSVAHSAYTIIKSSDTKLSQLECLALFVSCLCHDLDHRGRNNAFMINNSTPLASVYSTSTMEHHHFNQTVTILQNEGHNILKHLSAEEYKQVIGDIRNEILATDLAQFFGNKAALKSIVDKGELSWTNTEHRNRIKALFMTGCDLSAVMKPWDIQQQTVKVIFDEFYAQGDIEKVQGKSPMPMMDRNKAHELPQNQVGFIVGICLPCYELLCQIIPGSQPMRDGSAKNLQNWSALVVKQEEEKKLENSNEDKKDEKPDDINNEGNTKKKLSAKKSHGSQNNNHSSK